MATKGQVIKRGLIGAGIITAGLVALNILQDEQDRPENTIVEAPRTDYLQPGFYRTARNADIYSAPNHIVESVERHTCVQVVQNMDGYEYAGIRYAAGTAVGYASGYVKKNDIEPSSGCASLAQEFSRRAQAYQTPQSPYGQAAAQQGYILNNRSFIFPNAEGTAQTFTAELPAGTCVRVDFENKTEQVMKVTAKVNGQVVTGWGRTAIDYNRPCTPEL